MKNLTLRQENLKNFFFDIANKYSNDLTENFSWDYFWNNTALFYYMKETNDELFSLINKKFDTQAEREVALSNMQYPIMNEDEIEFIQVIKDNYYQEYGINPIKLEEKMQDIVIFFQNHRNLDFESLDTAGRFEALNLEGVTAHEYGIHNALGISHLEYLYLYQKGYYFK